MEQISGVAGGVPYLALPLRGTGCRVGLAGDPRRGDCGAGAAGLFTAGSRPSSGGIGSIGAARISTHGLTITPRSAS
jgi:hypothetical protein